MITSSDRSVGFRDHFHSTGWHYRTGEVAWIIYAVLARRERFHLYPLLYPIRETNITCLYDLIESIEINIKLEVQSDDEQCKKAGWMGDAVVNCRV